MRAQYTDTTGKLARDSGVTVPTVSLYADLELLQYIRSSNGTRLFLTGQAPKVKAIYARRMANRGRRQPPAEAAGTGRAKVA